MAEFVSSGDPSISLQAAYPDLFSQFFIASPDRIWKIDGRGFPSAVVIYFSPLTPAEIAEGKRNYLYRPFPETMQDGLSTDPKCYYVNRKDPDGQLVMLKLLKTPFQKAAWDDLIPYTSDELINNAWQHSQGDLIIKSTHPIFRFNMGLDEMFNSASQQIGW